MVSGYFYIAPMVAGNLQIERAKTIGRWDRKWHSMYTHRIDKNLVLEEKMQCESVSDFVV